MDIPTWLARPRCFIKGVRAAYEMQTPLIVKQADCLQEPTKCRGFFSRPSLKHGQRQSQTHLNWCWTDTEKSPEAATASALQCSHGFTGQHTTVGVPLFSGASELVAVFVHTPTLASAPVTLGGFKVAFVGASRKVGAWRKTETCAEVVQFQPTKTMTQALGCCHWFPTVETVEPFQVHFV